MARGFLAANRHQRRRTAPPTPKNDANVTADSYRDSDWEIAERLKKVAAGKELFARPGGASHGC